MEINLSGSSDPSMDDDKISMVSDDNLGLNLAQ